MPVDPLRRPALVLAAWSAFVWGNRLNNLRTDGSEGVRLVTSLVLSTVSLAFVVAVVVLVAVAWRRGRAMGVTAGNVVRAFAAWTVLVWVERAVAITVDWRSVGFVVVHVALGVVSIVLAAWAWRRAPRAADDAAPAGARPPAATGSPGR